MVAVSVLAGGVAVADPAAVAATGDASSPTAFSPPDSTLRDLGISTKLSDGRRLWVFGDTFEPGAARQSAVHSNTAAISEPGAPGELFEAFDANGHRNDLVRASAPESAFTNGQRFVSSGLQRVHDSREQPGTALGAGDSRDVVFPVPAGITGPVSAVFNLTAINTTAGPTHVEVSEPTAAQGATTSSLNLGGRETAANLVVASLGPPVDNVFAQPDRIRVRNNESLVEIVVDLVGFLAKPMSFPLTGQQFVPTVPTRVYDSAACAPGRNLRAAEEVVVSVRGASCLGRGTVPTDAVTVLVNLTADGPGSTRPTHLTAWASDQPMPPISNVNLADHDVRANLAVVPLSSSGEVRLFNSEGSFRGIVDVLGYFTDSPSPPLPSEFVPITPSRACDTRTAGGGCGGAIGPGEVRTVPVGGLRVPEGASAVALNVTAVFPSARTHLTVWGDGTMPVASNINAPPGSTRAAMGASPLAGDGTVKVFNNSGSVHLIVDVVGFFAPRASMAGACGSATARMANWPTSVITVPGAPPPATDRVVVYFVRYVVCGEWTFLEQEVGVATFDYRAGQSVSSPLIASRSRIAVAAGSHPPGEHVAGGVVMDGFVYLYGCFTVSPANVCYLRRAPVTSDLAKTSSYSYLVSSGGTAKWSPSFADETPVPFSPVGAVPDTQFPASDLSVAWVESLGPAGLFVMMYEPRWDSGNGPVIVRTAEQPWGPWSEPVGKVGGGQPRVPGCGLSAIELICRAFHVNEQESDSSRLWFSFYQASTGKLRYSTLPVTTNASA